MELIYFWLYGIFLHGNKTTVKWCLCIRIHRNCYVDATNGRKKLFFGLKCHQSKKNPAGCHEVIECVAYTTLKHNRNTNTILNTMYISHSQGAHPRLQHRIFNKYVVKFNTDLNLTTLVTSICFTTAVCMQQHFYGVLTTTR